MHSKEKEEKGECCQEEQQRAEQQTYEQSFITVELKEKNEKSQVCISFSFI